MQKNPSLKFDGLSQASARTGIPLRILKNGKRAGLPGFSGGRVNVSLFLAGYFARADKPGLNRSDCYAELAHAKAERERFRLSKERGSVISTEEVAKFIRMTFGPFRERLMGIPGRLAAKLNLTPEQRKIVDEEVAETIVFCREHVPSHAAIEQG